MINWMAIAPFILSATVLAPAVVIDVREYRIPNAICLFGFLAAVVLHGLLGGWGGLAMAATAGVLLLLLMFPFYVAGWLGAGDVKLIATVAALTGSPPAALIALLTIVVTGLVMALLLIAWSKGGKDFFLQPASILNHSRSGTPTASADPQHTATFKKLPYAVAIAPGALIFMGARIFITG